MFSSSSIDDATLRHVNLTCYYSPTQSLPSATASAAEADMHVFDAQTFAFANFASPGFSFVCLCSRRLQRPYSVCLLLLFFFGGVAYYIKCCPFLSFFSHVSHDVARCFARFMTLQDVLRVSGTLWFCKIF